MSLLLSLLSFQAAPVPPMEVELYRAQMRAAESAMRLGEFADARAWLDATPPALRGFEWRADMALLDESAAEWAGGGPEVGHALALDVSPSGGLAAVGTSRGVVELRDLATGARLAELGRHADAVSYLRFDAAGGRVVTASHDRTVKVWSVRERRLLVEFKGHGFPVGGAAFSPDGALVASCSYERPPGSVVGTVHVWNAATGELVRSMTGGQKPLVGLTWSADGTRIAAGSWDFCVFVWPASGGEPVRCPVPDDGIYNACDDAAFTPDGRFVLGASKDHTARVFSVAEGLHVATLRGHTDAVAKVAVSPDGSMIATASNDGTAKLWRVPADPRDDWENTETLRGHADDVRSLAFTPDGATLVTGSLDGTLRTWDLGTDAYGGVGTTADAAVYITTFSPDDTQLATASYDGRINIRDAATLAVLRSWQAHPEGKSCHALAWTPDGARLVSGSWEPVVRVFEAATGRELAALKQESGTTWLAVSPDGARAATCSGNAVVVWDLVTYAKVHAFAGHTAAVLSVAFSPDSRRCVSSARDGRALVFDAATGAPQLEIRPGSADIVASRFTSDGAHLVVGGRDGKLDLFRAGDGAHERPLARLRHGFDHIALSPDGARLAVASQATVLIDVAHGVVVGEQRRHVEQPYCVEFDHAGVRLATGSTDRTIAVIDTRPLRAR